MTRHIAIIGAGPAGLSFAKLLAGQPGIRTTVFEALPQVGGKSFTLRKGSTLIEMGTCYATHSHRIVLRWMREHGMTFKGLGEQIFDGGDVIDYIRRGGGSPLIMQVAVYLNARRGLLKRLRSGTPSTQTLQEAAMPVSDWLEVRRLHKIRRVMERALSSIAYGFLEELATVQALTWVDAELLASGLTKQLKMPVEGWGPFWERLAATMDVRTSTPVTGVERSDTDVVIHTPEGAQRFDEVACAIPFDDFCRLLPPAALSADERFIRDAVHYGGYTTTLLAAQDWFTGYHVEAYSAPIRPGAVKGELLSARLEGFEPDHGGHLYVTGQYSGDCTDKELRDILNADIAAKGARVITLHLQTRWRYMAHYNPDAIRTGLFARLTRVQGQRHTWYSGSAWSHEAVSHVVNHNARLIPQIVSNNRLQPKAA